MSPSRIRAAATALAALTSTLVVSQAALAAMTITPATPGQTDLNYTPSALAGGHEINHSPIGQTFKAVATTVNVGLFLQDALTAYQAAVAAVALCAPGCGISAYPVGQVVAPSVTVRMDLYAGAGINGTPLATRTVTVNAPFRGFVDLPAGNLVVGNTYTVVMTDLAPSATLKNWVVPSVTDPTPGAGQPSYGPDGVTVVGYLPYGAYYGGLPMLQGQVVVNDAGVGDKAFHVIDQSPTVGQPTCSGSGVITSYPISKVFLLLTDGSRVGFTPTPAGTTFTGGATTFANGEVVTYAGVYSSATTICQATTMTVAPAPVVTPPPPPPPAPASCSVPTGTVATAGKGRITAVGSGFFMVGSTKVSHLACTKRSMNGAAGFAVGQKVEWEGYAAPATGVVGTRITVN